jgi:polar amino acid transport system substrate-binding protein
VINLRTAVLAASLLLIFASAALADRLDEIKARGKLVVGVSDTALPFSFRKAADGSLTGYDLELVRALARRMGVGMSTR